MRRVVSTGQRALNSRELVHHSENVGANDNRRACYSIYVQLFPLRLYSNSPIDLRAATFRVTSPR